MSVISRTIRAFYIALAVLFLHGCSASKTTDASQAGGDSGRIVLPEEYDREYYSISETDIKEIKTHGNLMAYLGSNMKWKSYQDNKKVQTMIRFYTKKPEYLERSLNRGKLYLYHIVTELERRNMPLELALLPMVESAYQPYARSPKLAAGLWQFIPATGRRYKLSMDYWHDQRYDPVAATRAALDYLQDLVKMHQDYDDKWFLALASYNWGENNVKRKLRQNKAAGKKTDFWSIRKPKETANYVPSLLAMVEIVRDPGKYNVKLPAIAHTPYFEAVRLRRPIDLGIAARLADISMEELYALNGGLKRWLRPPQAPARLLVPVAKAPALRQKLEELADDEWLRIKKHKVARGDKLITVAARYALDVNLLKAINPYLRNRQPRVGEVLDIPQPEFNRAHYAARNSGNELRPVTGERLVHKVKSGESLWLIARKYGTTVARIKQWNNKRGNLLRPGQTLVVWLSGSARQKKAASTRRGLASRGRASSDGSYVVRRGDTLSVIAAEFGTRVSKLVALNNLDNAHKLRVGQKLSIPGAASIASTGRDNDPGGTGGEDSGATETISYTVKRGDSLWSIAKRYNVTVRNLLAWNSLDELPRHIRPGQLLQIITDK